VGSDLDGTPAVIGEIEIDVSCVLSDTDVDAAFRSVKLRPCLEQIECRTDFSCARGLPGRLVITAPQPGPKPLAPNRPGFSVAIDHNIGKCRVGGSVKRVTAHPNFCEHVGCCQADACVLTASPSGFEVRSAAAACTVASGAICPSSMRVFFQSLR